MARNKKENEEKRVIEQIRSLMEKYNIQEEDLKKIIEEAKERKESLEEYIKKNPIKSAALALLLGIILGKISK